MSNEPEPNSAPVVTPSLRSVVDTLVRSVQNRAELFGLELEEEGRWLLSALVWVTAAIFFGLVTVTTVTVAVVWFCPDTARPWVLLGFSVIYGFMAYSAIAGVKKHFRNRRAPLADTVNELKKDLDWIRSPE